MRTLTQKISFLFILLTLCIHSSPIFADDDISSPDYHIQLGKMDPLGVSHTGPVNSGMGAFTYILGQLADMMLFIIPVIAVISLIIAGYYYILSAGDSEKASKAKTIIKWNLISILIAFLSYAIINLVRYIIS